MHYVSYSVKYGIHAPAGMSWYHVHISGIKHTVIRERKKASKQDGRNLSVNFRQEANDWTVQTQG